MASKTFAHWNQFPFITTPRTKYHSEQLQSPFFRLPREIRDIIYDYYAQEKKGYIKENGKILYESDSAKVAGLGSILTCRIAAEEMKNVAFQTIAFITQPSVDDGGSYLGLCTRAGRLHILWQYIQQQRVRMLISIHELLELEDFNAISTRYPDVAYCFDVPLRQTILWRRNFLGLEMNLCRDDSLDQTLIDALQFALDLAKNKNPPRFAELTRKVFGVGICPLFESETQNLFVTGALSDVYFWRPAPWAISKDDELSRLEALLCQPDESTQFVHRTEDGIPFFLDMELHLEAAKAKWNFSATAVAIEFLQSLSAEQRRKLRKIVINEDLKSVCRPVCHARGLIPFCVENPELRIERHIRLLTNLLPTNPSWNIREALSSMSGEDCLDAIVPWIEEHTMLPTCGMPVQSFRLVLFADIKQSERVWTLLKYVAAMQEAMAALDVLPVPRWSDPASCSLFPLPWHLPVIFARSIRDIVERTSTIFFEGDVGQLWDQDLFSYERRDWTMNQWREEWNENILVKYISENFWPKYFDRYNIIP